MGNESDLRFKTLRRHLGDQALSLSVSPEFSNTRLSHGHGRADMHNRV